MVLPYILFVLMTIELILSYTVWKRDQDILLYKKVKVNKDYYFILNDSSYKFKLYNSNNLLYDNINNFKITLSKCYFIIGSTSYIINILNSQINIFDQNIQPNKKESQIFQMLVEGEKMKAD